MKKVRVRDGNGSREIPEIVAAIDRAHQEYDTGAFDIIEPHRRSLLKALAELNKLLKGGAA